MVEYVNAWVSADFCNKLYMYIHTTEWVEVRREWSLRATTPLFCHLEPNRTTVQYRIFVCHLALALFSKRAAVFPLLVVLQRCSFVL